jgi:hypothetical protein
MFFRSHRSPPSMKRHHEIEAQRVGNKNYKRSVFQRLPFLKVPYQILVQTIE